MNWEKFSEKVTLFNGSIQFFLGFSVAAIAGVLAGIFKLDKDFAFFTVVLSILAIYLPIFIQNSQNRSQKRLEEWIKTDAKNTEAVNKKLNDIVKYSKGINKK
jgi:uncharacterized membrane protein